MRFIVIFVTAVCVLFLIKLRWPNRKNFYDTVRGEFRTAQNTDGKIERFPAYNPSIYYACRIINYVCALLFLKTIETP